LKILRLPFISLDELILHILQEAVKHRQGVVEYALGGDWSLYIAHIFGFVDD
jgi:hypothetical protein